MKLRPLLLTVAVLAPVSALVWWLGRPAPAAASADPRVGQRVAEPDSLASAARVTIRSEGKSVELALGEGGRWTLLGDPVLPADASRLGRLTRDLVSPKIERLVSSNPERLATFEFGAAGLAYADAAGKPLLDLHLGKSLEGGARLLRYGEENKAYAARLNVWIDAEPASWRDNLLVAGLQASDIASIGISFPDTGSPVLVSRAAAAEPWTSPATPAGHQVKSSVLSSQTGNLTALRFTNLAPVGSETVAAARPHPRSVTFTTFAGRTVRFTLFRAPEPPAPPAPETPEGGEPPPPPPAAPRPVYVEVVDSQPDAILAAAARTHAFEVTEWVLTGLPATSADLFEPVPAPPAAAAPALSEGISVTTPPLTVPLPGETADTPSAPAPEEPAATSAP
jgi:hypothetical protein